MSTPRRPTPLPTINNIDDVIFVLVIVALRIATTDLNVLQMFYMPPHREQRILTLIHIANGYFDTTLQALVDMANRAGISGMSVIDMCRQYAHTITDTIENVVRGDAYYLQNWGLFDAMTAIEMLALRIRFQPVFPTFTPPRMRQPVVTAIDVPVASPPSVSSSIETATPDVTVAPTVATRVRYPPTFVLDGKSFYDYLPDGDLHAELQFAPIMPATPVIVPMVPTVQPGSLVLTPPNIQCVNIEIDVDAIEHEDVSDRKRTREEMETEKEEVAESLTQPDEIQHDSGDAAGEEGEPKARRLIEF